MLTVNLTNILVSEMVQAFANTAYCTDTSPEKLKKKKKIEKGIKYCHGPLRGHIDVVMRNIDKPLGMMGMTSLNNNRTLRKLKITLTMVA